MHFNKLSYSRDLNYIALKALKMHTPTSSEIIPTLALLLGALNLRLNAQVLPGFLLPSVICYHICSFFIWSRGGEHSCGNSDFFRLMSG